MTSTAGVRDGEAYGSDSDSSTTPRASPVLGHRRRQTVIYRPLVSSQPPSAAASFGDPDDAGLGSSRDSELLDLQVRELNRLQQQRHDLQAAIAAYSDDPDDDHIMAGNNAFPALDTSMNAGNRNSASPTTAHPGSSVNGNGVGASANYMATLPVGHQQDLNYLYGQIQELAAILRSNREKVNVITRAAEEVGRRANGALGDGNRAQEGDKGRIRDLERDLAKANHLIELYKHEQKENTNLIAMYEDGMGTATEQIRNYCGDIEGRFLAQRRHYNNLLQQEKDEHLESRLDRDHWHAQTLRVCEMIRTAYRLRTDEWGEEYPIISGLQSEVRCYRRVLGMEAEKPEEETGWPYLKDLPLNDQN